MRWFDRLSLSRQFLVASFPIMLVGMVAIGLEVEREIEQGVIARLAEVQSLYVDSLVAPYVPELVAGQPLDAARKSRLDALFADTPLGRRVVAFILWRPDGRILYSSEAALTGREFPVGRGLRAALSGNVDAKVIDRGSSSHVHAASDWPARLIETYAPVHAGARGKVVGAAEFYQATDELDREMAQARWRTWGVVALATLAMYVLLFALVWRGSETILSQREELRARVDELDRLASANADLAVGVKRASARTAALNEAFLLGVAADLHDGPAQDLGFAQMRVDSMASAAAVGSSAGEATVTVASKDLDALRAALAHAMRDLRAIGSGLQLPDIESLAADEVASRAVRDYERKTDARVTFECSGDMANVALPIRMTLFRVLQEMLANGFRHARGASQRVVLRGREGEIELEATDAGPGFDVTALSGRRGGGLAGMHERVKALGGTVDISSTPGAGTRVLVRLPRRVAEQGDD